MDRMPVFVKIDDYEQVIALIKVVHEKLEDAKTTLNRIHELKNEEDHHVEMWQNTLGEVEKKLEFIEHSLNEPEHTQ
ncbi:hypothetical protein HYV86_06125 [Candidatus Woesearchaeota archaeon]|nr:hypothetical protein [Candidatus Woesearchaeota archaeon]